MRSFCVGGGFELHEEEEEDERMDPLHMQMNPGLIVQQTGGTL